MYNVYPNIDVTMIRSARNEEWVHVEIYKSRVLLRMHELRSQCHNFIKKGYGHLMCVAQTIFQYY